MNTLRIEKGIIVEDAEGNVGTCKEVINPATGRCLIHWLRKEPTEEMAWNLEDAQGNRCWERCKITPDTDTRQPVEIMASEIYRWGLMNRCDDRRYWPYGCDLLTVLCRKIKQLGGSAVDIADTVERTIGIGQTVARISQRQALYLAHAAIASKIKL